MPSDYGVLDQMVADYLDGPAIYHASRFWEKINRMNVEWLKKDGINNFKRSVNNNYFNWMVSPSSPYLVRTMKAFVGRHFLRPLDLLSVLMARLESGEMGHKTYVAE